MKILSLGGSNHDYSACLFIDGRVVVAIEEERLTRKKHSLGAGVELARNLAADYCLSTVGLSIDDIDVVVGNDILNPIYYHRFRNRIKLFNHHDCHAASALYCVRDRRSCAVLVVDGFGSEVHEISGHHETITAYRVSDDKLDQILRVTGSVDRTGGIPSVENSLGGLYLTVTRAVGFKFMHEGKTMGLASYGRPTYVQMFAKHVVVTVDGQLSLTRSALKEIEQICFDAISDASEEEKFQVRADLAFAAQTTLEAAMLSLAKHVAVETGANMLCLAGGVALNGVANWKILSAGLFESVFIQPACGDAGTSLGAALLEAKEHGFNCEEPFSPYLGREYSVAEMLAALEAKSPHLAWLTPTSPEATVAEYVAQGAIVAVFSGRSEIGPRALGNRSILANPCIPNMGAILNERIKHREAFRPFAPIVMAEHQFAYFETDHESYHMLLVPPVRSEKRSVIPAVTHVDGTGRVQTVSAESNPQLYKILSEFSRVTGVPVMLNTSFNDNEEPIVESPQDAVNALLSLSIDYLLLGPYLVQRAV